MTFVSFLPGNLVTMPKQLPELPVKELYDYGGREQS